MTKLNRKLHVDINSLFTEEKDNRALKYAERLDLNQNFLLSKFKQQYGMDSKVVKSINGALVRHLEYGWAVIESSTITKARINFFSKKSYDIKWLKSHRFVYICISKKMLDSLTPLNSSPKEGLDHITEKLDREVISAGVMPMEQLNIIESLHSRANKDYESQRENILNALNKDIASADTMLTKKPKEWCENYQKIKLEWLRKVENIQWYEKTTPNQFSDAQLNAIGNMSQFCLLRARAGSGKTTVVKHKIDLLLTKAGIQPDEIMALAFNKTAAQKITKELQSQFGHITFNNSRTFHGLAHRIVNPTKELLYDENSGTQAKQSQYVESLLRDELNPTVVEIIYDYFRREMAEVENIGSLLSKSEYFQMRRNSTYETLKGEQVKSLGEKWIADFLYEHDIRYVYERPWPLNAREKEGNYHPDFSIMVQRKGADIILEHWGIDEFDPNRSIPEHWNQSWESYHGKMVLKREFWADKTNPDTGMPIVFLETSIRDLKKGRVSFECILKQKFEDCGVIVQRLPDEQLYDNVVRRRVPILAKMLGSFIQKAKLRGLSPNDIDKKIEGYSFSCDKQKIFSLLSSRIYHRYQANLGNRLDFNDLMKEAVGVINAKKGSVSISSGDQSNIKLDKLKWLIIDEYQDFSQLFLNLINALRTYNPSLNVFCVGDDWQAINAFAGSDLKFFNRFGDYFEGATLLDLPDNYRSQREIVSQSNKFMKDESGEPSISMRPDITSQRLARIHTCDCFIDYNPAANAFLKFKTFEPHGQKRNLDPSYHMARLFRLCWEVMRTHSLPDTTFMILGRSDSPDYAYKNMDEFKRKLKTVFSKSESERFTSFDSQVTCSTVHKSKGLEADVVIVLNVNERGFPIIHPNNQLYGILGVTMKEVYKEERRLFYVALTRAKKMLYLLHEKNLKSEFVSEIELKLKSYNRWLSDADQTRNNSVIVDDILF